MSWEDEDFDTKKDRDAEAPESSKASWEDENWEATWEQKPGDGQATQKPVTQPKPKPPVKPEKKEPEKPLTTEEKSQLKKDAEKQAKLADYDNAVELFKGVDENKQSKHISEDQLAILTKLEPANAADFIKLATAIGSRTKKYEENLHYPHFVKELCKSLCLSDKMNSSDVSEIVKALNVLVNDKLKAEKAPKKGMKKTAAKKKVAAATTATKSFDIEDEEEGGVEEGGGDYDDFM